MGRSDREGATGAEHLEPPTSDHLLTRPRLTALLDGATSRRLTTVIAPAGFGKTAAVAGWARARGEETTVTWLTCRPEDDDVARFTDRLLAATSRLLPGLLDGRPPTFEHLSAALVTELGRRPDAVVSVIDAIEHAPAAGAALAGLIEAAPGNWRFVVVSRRSPFPSVARLRASGELSDIGASELRFDVAESARLLAARGLDAGVAALVHSATGGWPAAVAEACAYLATAGDIGAALEELGQGRALPGRAAAEEAVRVLPASAQAVLADAALLRHADRRGWAAVAGDQRGAAAYEAAVAAQLVVPVGERWHRAHPPLQWISQSQVAADGRRRARVLGRAAQWAAREDLVEDAVTYAFAAGDDALGSALVAEYAERFTGRGRPDRLLRLVADLDEDLARRPEILVQRGWAAVMAGDLSELASVIEVLETGPETMADRPIAGSIFRIALALLTGDSTGALTKARALTADLDAHPEDGQVDPGWAWAFHAAAASMAGDFEEAAAAARVVVNGGFVGQPLILAAGVAAVIELHGGAPDRAARLARLAMSVADAEFEADLPVCAPGLFVLAHDADPIEAARALRRLRRLGDLTPDPYVDLLVSVAEAVQASRAGASTPRRAGREARAVAAAMLGVPGLARYIDGVDAQVEAAARMATVDSRLSNAEVALLRLMDRRLSRREIAAELGVSVNTVKFHARSLFRKLGAASSIEAVERGRRLGVLPPAPPPGGPPGSTIEVPAER